MGSSTTLIPEQRHAEMLRLLRSVGVLSIRDMTEQLGVSHMTVRRDIAALEELGRVVAVPGGVRLTDWTGSLPPRERKRRTRIALPQKRAIARSAAHLVADGSVVFLDAGTTCESMVRFLAVKKNLTIVTNDFFTAVELLQYRNVDAIHTGGAIDAESGSASGPIAAVTLASISIDVCFLSTGAWDIPHGLTTPSTEKMTLKQQAMRSASVTYLLADSGKFGTHETFHVAPLRDLDAVVTDAGIDAHSLDDMRGSGIDVKTADADTAA